MKTGIIYMCKNNTNLKCYIGQTVSTLQKRKSEHLLVALNPKSKKRYYFHKALTKYGFDQFEWLLLWEGDINLLSKMEIYYINLYDSYNNGYNLTLGGGGKLGNKGKKHHNYDNTLYTFYHKTGLVEILTKYDFRNKYNVENSGVCKLFSNPKTTTHGWTLNPSNFKETYCFTNGIITEIDIELCVMYKKYNLDRSGLVKVVKGKRKSYRKWVLISKSMAVTTR